MWCLFKLHSNNGLDRLLAILNMQGILPSLYKLPHQWWRRGQECIQPQGQTHTASRGTRETGDTAASGRWGAPAWGSEEGGKSRPEHLLYVSNSASCEYTSFPKSKWYRKPELAVLSTVPPPLDPKREVTCCPLWGTRRPQGSADPCSVTPTSVMRTSQGGQEPRCGERWWAAGEQAP